MGMVCRVFVMVGLPFQTQRVAGPHCRFLRQPRPHRLHVKPFQWYPGIALSQASAPDAAEQAAFLRAAIEQRPRLWRRVARRLALLDSRLTSASDPRPYLEDPKVLQVRTPE